MELFHHFQHQTAPTLCFAEVWGPAISIAFKKEYLMTAMLATSARHLSILQPENAVYSEAAMALLSRACASFSAALDAQDGGEKHDALFFTAMLIHYLTWCNLDFLESQTEEDDSQGPDLRRDQLFLLSSGVRVFLHKTRAQGPSSIFANMSSISQCSALENIVEAQGMDSDAIVQAFMERYDAIGAPKPSPPVPVPEQASVVDREAYRAIVSRLSVILALCEYKDANATPPERSDIERYVFSFPLFCVGTFLDMIGAGDARAVLVLYHFYRTSMLIMGDGVPWWAAGRFEVMVRVLGEELERRHVGRFVRGLS
ncbi:C6 transcription factor [Colletotrichum karsti]|uniref:C6 transcription factor n=1 Tax=Colletotrichum karsti TaxID=1095194 RepID=A0A9P6LGZ3_9PEZI|nr:C6 transcription factor [Colletotrichum karsti]KAF9872701.1 C6 transcription factor [Colletotrichum karsti]